MEESSASDTESSAHSEEESTERTKIREDLSSMTMEEILKLKEELGTKVYKEAVFGIESAKPQRKKHEFKRLNKNRPRELSSKRQVPFLCAELRTQRKKEVELRDPRFDEKSGEYDSKNFKNNYKFVAGIREREVEELRTRLNEAKDDEERQKIKFTIQQLVNKNVEEKNWHTTQAVLKKEQAEVQKAREEGKTPHYATKKERRAKELVMKFEELKRTGKLNKHLEKRRKKNTAKDRKKFSFD